MDLIQWRTRWANQRGILANLLTTEKGFKYLGAFGTVHKYRKGEYEVWISWTNPDVWIYQNDKTAHNAEMVFADAPYAADKQVKLYEFLSTV